MPMYRKKPVQIEARCVHPSTISDIANWCGGDVCADGQSTGITITTLEGAMTANPGDWVIRGVRGEFYPCKPDIFAQTYEEAETARMSPEALDGGPFRVAVIEGLDAVELYESEGRKLDEDALEDEGGIIHPATFATRAEAEAFTKGLEVARDLDADEMAFHRMYGSEAPDHG